MKQFEIEIESRQDFCTLYWEDTKEFLMPENGYHTKTSNIEMAEHLWAHDAVAKAHERSSHPTPVKVHVNGNKYEIREVTIDDYRGYLFESFKSDFSFHHEIPTVHHYTKTEYPKEWVEAAKKVQEYGNKVFGELK